MKKCVPRLQGIEEQIAKVDKIVFMAVKQDILEMIRPLSKILQSNDLLTPELLTSIMSAKKALNKVQKLIRQCGSSTLTDFPQFFPAASGIITQLESDDIVINDRNRVGGNDSNSSIQGFRLRGSLENALDRTKDRMLKILDVLVDVIKNRFAEIVENPIYNAF